MPGGPKIQFSLTGAVLNTRDAQKQIPISWPSRKSDIADIKAGQKVLRPVYLKAAFVESTPFPMPDVLISSTSMGVADVG